MNPKVNLFLVHTEYHLLISNAIILNLYSDRGHYKNIVVFDYSSKRLTNDYFYPAIPATFLAVDLSQKDLSGITQKLLNFNPDRFFFFQEISILDQYLLERLYKKGTTTCLVQDGLKPYVVTKKKHELLSALKDTLFTYLQLCDRGLCLKKFKIFNWYRYGHVASIMEVWLTHPGAFYNPKKKNIYQIPEIAEKDVVSKLAVFFKFESKNDFPNSLNVVFYINQPFKNASHIKTEIQFLQQVRNKFPDKDLIIKIHPLTPQTTIALYSEINNVHIIKKKIPAELYILSLKNSVVLSGWSTSLLTYNPTCNYFYMYKIFEPDKILKQLAPANPTDYITEVACADEITFPDYT
ncbi:MAG TPA: polysialyltransferase family glycosyltransferase [Bacteroidales bacterium]|nr:polysialyltransferase family glycosyltransferase [Bacteroidales bacterium]